MNTLNKEKALQWIVEEQAKIDSQLWILKEMINLFQTSKYSGEETLTLFKTKIDEYNQLIGNPGNEIEHHSDYKETGTKVEVNPFKVEMEFNSINNWLDEIDRKHYVNNIAPVVHPNYPSDEIGDVINLPDPKHLRL